MQLNIFIVYVKFKTVGAIHESPVCATNKKDGTITVIKIINLY